MKVRVTAKPLDGFNRAGRRWSSAGDEVEVSSDVLAILEAEPLLSVERLDSEASAPVEDRPRRHRR